MLVKYVSNPKLSNSKNIGLVSLSDDVFVFTSKINFNTENILDIEFSVCDETGSKEYGFYIKNTSFEGYNLSNFGLETVPFSYKGGSVFYFDEEFQIKNDKLYKRITENDSPLENWLDYYLLDGKTYGLKDSDFKLAKLENGYKIIKEIIGAKPLAVGSIINDNKSEIILYDNTSFYNENGKWCRIIVSENCKLISLWLKNTEGEIFEKIKTFSYPGGIEKAGIKLAIDESMELNQLSISFLKADV